MYGIKPKYKVVFLMLFLLSSLFLNSIILADNSTTGKTEPAGSQINQQGTNNQNNLKILLIKISAVDKVMKAYKNVKEVEISYLENQLLMELSMTGKFRKIFIASSTPETKTDYILDISIVDLYRVSETGRAWGGWMAGKATVIANVNFIDASNDQSINVIKVEGKSNNNTTTNNAVYSLAKQIELFVIKTANEL